MNIYETKNNSASKERIFICKESLTYYNLQEVKQAFWKKAIDILNKYWKVQIKTLVVK
jgi:hypothetical protein